MKKDRIFLALDRSLKKIIPSQYHHVLAPLKKKLSPCFVRALSSVWCITWKCNFACPYCWQMGDPERYRADNSIFYRQWVEIWKRVAQQFDTVTVSITGGEPFLFRDFLKLLMELPDTVRYDITSNLSVLNVEEFLSHEKIRKHCLGISCSFHPSNASNPENYVDVFFEKAKTLNVLPGTKINFVPADSNLAFYGRLKEFCDKNRISLHVKKKIDLKKSHRNTPGAESAANDMALPDTGQYNKSNMRKIVSCSAGLSHLALFPNADAWPCYTKAALNEDYIGNVLSEEFRLNTAYMDCSLYPSCWRVDYHNVNVVRKKKSQ